MFGFTMSRIAGAKMSFVLSAFILWLLILGFNFWGEVSAPDREITQGIWLPFQIFFGTLVVVIGIAACWYGRTTGKKHAL